MTSYLEHARLTEAVTKQTSISSDDVTCWHLSATVYKFRSYNVDFWKIQYTVAELGETVTTYRTVGQLRHSMNNIPTEDLALTCGLMNAQYRAMAAYHAWEHHGVPLPQHQKAIVVYGAFLSPVQKRINDLLTELGTDTSAYLDHTDANTRRKANALHYVLLARDSGDYGKALQWLQIAADYLSTIAPAASDAAA